ncbi:unnamed protein product, partial [Candidula unifasciata]
YLEADRIIQLANRISDLYIWILVAIGLPGNIFTIITVAAMKIICPAKFLISLLAALDTVSLICKLTGHQMVRNAVYIGPVGCKFEFIIPYTATLANWVLVLICAERFVTVCFKERKTLIFSLRNCHIMVVVLSAFLLLIFACISMPMRSANFSGFFCGTYNKYVWFWIHVWYWINSCLYLFLPSMFIVPMTALMLHRLRVSNRNGILQQNDDIGSESQAPVAGKSDLTEEELENNERMFTLMVFLAAVFFVILCLPACIFYLSYRHHDDVLTHAQWALYEQFQFFLADSTHAINFFLYFLSARQFQAKALDILLCKPCRKHSYSPGHRLD